MTSSSRLRALLMHSAQTVTFNRQEGGLNLPTSQSKQTSVSRKMSPLERSRASLEPSDPVSTCLRPNRQVSFSEVNCPRSMSGNGAGSAQWDIFSCTLKWARTIIHQRVRHMLAVVQGENAALTVRRPDVWKGQMWSHDCVLYWGDLGSSLSHEGVICKMIPSGQKPPRLQYHFSYAQT